MKYLTGLFITIMVVLTVASNSFASGIELKDISNHWAKSNIEDLINKFNAINGYPDGTFKPENTITRAEFLKVVLSAQGIKAKNATEGHWATNYYKEAVKASYISDGEMSDLDKNITREEMATIQARALKEEITEKTEDYTWRIRDFNSVPEKSKEFVIKCFIKGLMTGYEDKTFKCSNTATRAEAVTMVLRLVDSSKRVVPTLIKKPKYVNDIDFSSKLPLLELTEIDDCFNASYRTDGTAPYYDFTYTEINPQNNNANDAVLSVSFYYDNGINISISMPKYDEKNIGRVKKVLELLVPSHKDEILKNIVSYKTDNRRDRFSKSLNKTAQLFIMQEVMSIYPYELAGEFINFATDNP